MTKIYSFSYQCGQCRQIFAGSATVPVDDKHTGFIHGFLCFKCAEIHKLSEYGLYE